MIFKNLQNKPALIVDYKIYSNCIEFKLLSNNICFYIKKMRYLGKGPKPLLYYSFSESYERKWFLYEKHSEWLDKILDEYIESNNIL